MGGAVVSGSLVIYRKGSLDCCFRSCFHGKAWKGPCASSPGIDKGFLKCSGDVFRGRGRLLDFLAAWEVART